MTLPLILLALAVLLTGVALYELHVSREISALADRLTAALDACGDTAVTIQWRTRQAPWDMHRADLRSRSNGAPAKPRGTCTAPT